MESSLLGVLFEKTVNGNFSDKTFSIVLLLAEWPYVSQE